MTGSRPDPRASDDDLDPTGVRALLANLPDPGPMPDDLMARIAQSLELEQQRRAANGTDLATGPDHTGTHAVATERGDLAASPAASVGGVDEDSVLAEGPGGEVISLTTERARRRPGRTLLWLGGAAAVAMVATVSVNQLVGGDADSGVAADVAASQDSSASREESADDAGAEGGSAADDAGADEGPSGEDAAAEEPAAPAPSAGDSGDGDHAPAGGESESEQGGALSDLTQLYGVSDTLELSSTEWHTQVGSWLADGTPVRDEEAWSREATLDCVTVSELDTGQATTIMLARANLDDEAATVLVTQAASGDRAWVLSADCGEVLSGPVALD